MGSRESSLASKSRVTIQPIRAYSPWDPPFPMFRSSTICVLLLGVLATVWMDCAQGQEPLVFVDAAYSPGTEFTGPMAVPSYYEYAYSHGDAPPPMIPAGYFFPAGDSDWVWTFRPKGFLYGTYWANVHEPRLSVQVGSDRNIGGVVDSNIGGRVAFVRFGPRYRLEGWQLDVLGGAKLRQDPDDEMDVQSVDFRYDIPLTYRRGPHGFKTGFYHISAHTGDEFLLKHPDFERLNYLRDVWYLGYSYNVIPELRLYSEAGWAFNNDVSEPWEFQFGFDYGPACPTRIFGHPFLAMNVHLRQELNFGGNFNAQAGWAWRGEGFAAGTLRVGGYYFDGGSPQQAFYAQHEQTVGLGLWYDY